MKFNQYNHNVTLTTASFSSSVVQYNIGNVTFPFQLNINVTPQTTLMRVYSDWNDTNTTLLTPTFSNNIINVDDSTTQTYYINTPSIAFYHKYRSTGTYSVSTRFWDINATQLTHVLNFTIDTPTFDNLFSSLIFTQLLPSFSTGNYYASIVNNGSLYFTLIDIVNPVFSSILTLNGVGTLIPAGLLSAVATSRTLSGIGTVITIGALSAVGTTSISGLGTTSMYGYLSGTGFTVISGTGTTVISGDEIYSLLATSLSAIYQPVDYDGIRVLS